MFLTLILLFDIFNTNTSICTQLKGFKYRYLTLVIHFNINNPQKKYSIVQFEWNPNRYYHSEVE